MAESEMVGILRLNQIPAWIIALIIAGCGVVGAAYVSQYRVSVNEKTASKAITDIESIRDSLSRHERIEGHPGIVQKSEVQFKRFEEKIDDLQKSTDRQFSEVQRSLEKIERKLDRAG